MNKLILIAVLTFTVSSAIAEIRINGFANLTGGITSSDDTLYGYDDKISFTDDSLFAIQISGDINDRMSATGQIIARGEEDYDAKLVWAYMSYDIDDNFQVSVGRFRVPLFKYSATLDVGYSYNWITPPQSVYDVAFNNMDGFRLSYGTYSGDWEYRAQLTVGDLDRLAEFGGIATKFELENFITGSIEAQRDWLTLRAVYGYADSTFLFEPFNPLLNALSLAGYDTLAEDLRVEEDPGVFIGAGFDIDVNNWFVSGEYTYTTTEDSIFPETTAYYINAGLRFGKFTPFITFEDFENEAEMNSQISQIASGNPIPIAPGVSIELRDLALGTINSFAGDRTTFSVGFRYDWDTNIAVKVQYTNQDDKLLDANDADLLRFGVNYVF